MIHPDEAFELIMRRVAPLAARSVALAEAAGMVLAEDIIADRDQPPADRSAMDGFAVRAIDVPRQPRTLKLIGESSAGSADSPAVSARTCVEIFTGANVPKGADAVIPLEQTQREGDSIRFLIAARPGLNIRKRGEEVAAGQTLIKAGAVIGSPHAGICAMVGRIKPLVHPQPKATVLVTGAEVREASETPADHELRDSNGPALQSAFARWSLPAPTIKIVTDDQAVIVKEIKSAADASDIIIITGGVSVGKYDYALAALEKVGSKLHFHGVAMKPGKPQMFATLDSGPHVFGLPGNPLSVLTGFHEFVLPAIRRMSGLARESCRTRLKVKLDADVKTRSDRANYILARLAWMSDGVIATVIRTMGSADIAASPSADGVIVMPAEICELARGDISLFTPWRPLP